MMFRNKTASGFPVVLSFVVIYLVLFLFIFLFADRLIRDLAENKPFSGWFFVIAAIAMSVVLLVVVILNTVRIANARVRQQAGAAFRARLVLFFTLIVALSAVPQGILTVNIINSVFSSWMGPSMGTALSDGLRLAVGYFDDRITRIKRLGDNLYLADALAAQNPEEVLRRLQALEPDCSAFQVLDQRSRQVRAAGDPKVMKADAWIYLGNQDGLLPKETTAGGESILRFKRTLQPGSQVVILSMLLDETVEKQAGTITTANRMYERLDEFRLVFVLIIALFYIMFAIPLMLLAVITSFFLGDEIAKPFVRFEEATKRVADGDFSFRMLSRQDDDLFQLVASFNAMVAELEISRNKIVQTEKVSAWQEIAQRLAHEIRNPLTPIRLSAERLLKKRRENVDDFDKLLENAVGSILREVDGLDKMLVEFRNFARLPAPKKALFSFEKMIDELVAMYRDTMQHKILVEGINPEHVIFGDEGQIRHAFSNLIQNAVDAMPDPGTITIQSHAMIKKGVAFCRISIADTGEGIGETERSQVFNPYYSTREGGTGLGLSMVERIIHDHQGQVWFDSRVGAGTVFFIDLPMEECP